LKKIKEFANFPFMKKIPANYADAEKAFSEVYPMSRTILNFRGQKLPWMCYDATAFPPRRIGQR
jgi:hypothetical protein